MPAAGQRRDSVVSSESGLLVSRSWECHALVYSMDVDVLDLCCGKGSPQRRLVPDRLRHQPPLPRHVLLAVLQQRPAAALLLQHECLPQLLELCSAV